MIPGKYQLVSSTNSAAAYAAIGIPDDMTAQLISTANIKELELSVGDGSYTYSSTHTLTPQLNETTTMKLGEEVESKAMPGVKTTLTKLADSKFMSTGKFGKVVYEYVMAFNNFGFTAHLSVQGTGVSSTEVWKRMDPPINGFYTMEWQKGAEEMWLAEIPAEHQGPFKQMIKDKDMSFTVKMCGSDFTMKSNFGGQEKVQHFKLDEEYTEEEEAFGMKSSNLMTLVSPGVFKMVTKNLKNGSVTELDVIFTKEGLLEKGTKNGKSFEMFFKRGSDIEGSWRVVSESGKVAYLDACGVPEPMRTKMLNHKTKFQINRLPGGVISMTSDNEFMADFTYKMGEQYTMDIPGLGSSSGIATECDGVQTSVMKFGPKVITQTSFASGDFSVSELVVDGCIGSNYKMICVRE